MMETDPTRNTSCAFSWTTTADRRPTTVRLGSQLEHANSYVCDAYQAGCNKSRWLYFATMAWMDPLPLRHRLEFASANLPVPGIANHLLQRVVVVAALLTFELLKARLLGRTINKPNMRALPKSPFLAVDRFAEVTTLSADHKDRSFWRNRHFYLPYMRLFL